MIKVQLDGDNYAKIGKNWVDENYIIVPTDLCRKLYEQYLEIVDYKTFSFDDFVDLVLELKENEFHSKVISMIKWYLANKLDKEFLALRRLLPILTSSYRSLNKPETALQLYEKAYHKYGKSIVSAALLTSVAAAYCDVKEYETAKGFCDRAYAMQGGGKGYATELFLVYKRIEKEKG